MKNKWLFDIRNKKQLSQQAIANKAGITVQHYNYIENNHRRPSPDVAKRIADTLGFSDEWYRLLDTKPGSSIS